MPLSLKQALLCVHSHLLRHRVVLMRGVVVDGRLQRRVLGMSGD